MEVIQLRNPNALLVPGVQKLLKAAIASDALLAPGGFDTLAEDFMTFCTSPDHFLFLGMEKGEFKTLLMGYFPGSQIFPYPTVILFYNEGSPELRKATQRKYMDIMLERGYTQSLAVNGSKRSDKAWMKLLTPEGSTSERVGSLVMFTIQ